jgi:predicted metal-dependent peptidase
VTNRLFTAEDSLKISAARLLAAGHQPYLSSVLFAMKPVYRQGSTDISVDVSSDDKWRIYFTSSALQLFSAQEIAGVWLHQAAHCVRGHANRFKALAETDSKASTFRQAADAIINEDLRSSKVPLPGHFQTLGDLRLRGIDVPENISTERLFHLLVDDNDQVGHATSAERKSEVESKNHDCGSSSDGITRDYEEVGGHDEEDIVSQERAESIRANVAVEIRHFERRGDRVSKAFSRWSKSLLEPTIDWREELASHIRRDIALRIGSRNHTYSRPSRRQSAITALGQGTILPAMLASEPPVVAIVVDTSASIDGALLDIAVAEVSGVLASVGRSSRGVIFISCDSSAYLSRIRQVEDIALVGGGGTDMRVGIALALEQRPIPQLVIVITDGETPWPDSPRLNESVLVVLTDETYASEIPTWMRSVNVS